MLHTPWPQSFYSRILAPNRKELVSFIKDENAVLHPDQEFIWGNDCLMEKKERLGDYDKILELLSPSLRLFWNEITRLTGVDIIDNLDVQVNEAWRNYYTKGNFQEVHDHPGCQLVCVIFGNEWETDFSRFFIMNRHGSEVDVFWKSIIPVDQIWMKPREGDVVFIPPWMLHGVSPHKSDKTRITASVNLNFRFINQPKFLGDNP